MRVGGRLTIDSGQSILTTFGRLAGDYGSPVLADPWHDEDVEKIPMVWGVRRGIPPHALGAHLSRSVLVVTRICPLAANRSFTVMNAQSDELEVKLNCGSHV